MPKYDFDIGIIGAGAAGLTVAAGASQLGARTLLVEKEKELGGDCLHFGCVPSKTLIRTANVYHLFRRSGDFGLPPLDMKPVDFRSIVQRIRSVVGTIQKHDSKERFCTLGVRVESGYSFFKDEHAIDLNGETLSARTWVIATGSSPSIPEIEGLDNMPYLTNRDFLSWLTSRVTHYHRRRADRNRDGTGFQPSWKPRFGHPEGRTDPQQGRFRYGH
ncbi:hypothetical protein NBG4_20040 [Candidatus Sulfobium mesophilum]|uniref:FAD/NAD(P)-binding domain-containing protein n=1 Tax=Candidatus Sulfobium mesophilum TaxID=2016548 RepID=A0A2U3QFQ8_9BACT|nr:hypothetical protein NBG4_20040 [Candidatus Sulfobium mesophilum]